MYFSFLFFLFLPLFSFHASLRFCLPFPLPSSVHLFNNYFRILIMYQLWCCPNGLFNLVVKIEFKNLSKRPRYLA